MQSSLSLLWLYNNKVTYSVPKSLETKLRGTSIYKTQNEGCHIDEHTDCDFQPHLSSVKLCG